MSDSDEQLSQRLREQVAALHEPPGGAALAPLSGEAQQRMLQRMALEAARLRARRSRRLLLQRGAGALLLAAAALLLWLRSSTPPPAAFPVPQPQLQPKAAAQCALPVLTQGPLQAAPGLRLPLGALGALVTQPGTQLGVERSSACELVLRLDSGTLAGDLHSLRPARLSIRTAQAEVIVTGTRFSVHSDSELEVLLESGVVEVQALDGQAGQAVRGAGRLLLQPQTRLRKPAGAGPLERQRLSAADAARLAHWLEPLPPTAAKSVSAPAPSHKPGPQLAYESSSAALAVAEAANRAGRWPAAREAYQAASQMRDMGAEVALLRWARFELDRAAPRTALRLLAEHRRRFSRGSLGAEAGWLEVEARNRLGQRAGARRAARALMARHAGSPQAAAAAQLLELP